MARITATANDSTSTFEVADGTKLVLALEDNGVDILHKCGGNARCTTCQVQFSAGEPASKTDAEVERAAASELGDARLSCQIEASGDMALTVVMTVSSSDSDDPGPTPETHITP